MGELIDHGEAFDLLAAGEGIEYEVVGGLRPARPDGRRLAAGGGGYVAVVLAERIELPT